MQFLINLAMVEREEILAKYVERTLLGTFQKWAKELEKPLSVVDFLGCFGNSTLAIANCFHKIVSALNIILIFETPITFFYYSQDEWLY